MNIQKGDIFYADLTPVIGSEQGGVRPVVIIQNNVGNRYSPTVIVAAIISRMGKHPLPTHVPLDGIDMHYRPLPTAGIHMPVGAGGRPLSQKA